MVFVDVVCHLLYSEMIAIFFCSLLYFNNQFHLLHYYFFLMHHLHLQEPFVGISLGMDWTSQQCFFFHSFGSLQVLYNLAPLFPRNIILFWQDEVCNCHLS